jgi:hypothetical protein
MTAVVEIPADDVTLAQAAVAATRGVPGVVDINRGRYATARTFGPGGRVVEGIQLTHEPEGVHVVVQRVPIPLLVEAVRAALATTLRGLGSPVTAVDVWVDDLRRSEEEML